MNATRLFTGSTAPEIQQSAGHDLYELSEWTIEHPECFCKKITFHDWTQIIENIRHLALEVAAGDFLKHFDPVQFQGDIEIETRTKAAEIAVAVHKIKEQFCNENLCQKLV